MRYRHCGEAVKKRFLVPWIDRNFGVLSLMAKEQGTTKQNTFQIVKRAGLLDYARSLRESVWPAERRRRLAAKREEAEKRRRANIKRCRTWRRKHAEARRAALDAEQKVALAEAIERTGGCMTLIEHELGIKRMTVSRWVERYGLREALVAAQERRRAERKDERRWRSDIGSVC